MFCYRPIALTELIQQCEKLTGQRAQVVHKPARVFDNPTVWLDLARAKSVLGWAPTIEFEQGIRLTWDWIRAQFPDLENQL